MSKHKETGKHIRAFEVWWDCDRDFRKTSLNLVVPETTIRTWADWFGWRDKADERDAAAAAKATAEAVKRKAAMLVRHRQAGELLTKRGMEFHARQKIETAKDATGAIVKGVEIERQAEGMPATSVDVTSGGLPFKVYQGFDPDEV